MDETSCAGLKKSGISKSGVYEIAPIPGYTVKVFCDQVTDGGGWTVIQKRLDGSVDFFRGWDDYKRGFGNKNGEYWLGLDAMHILTNSTENEIRIDLEDFNMNKTYAIYKSFKVGTESQKYELFIGSFKEGNAGDSLGYHRWTAFSTSDQDNDNHATNCANRFKGAWWFGGCHYSHLNGQYLGQNVPYAEGINWRFVTGLYRSLKSAEMKIRPVGYNG
ncbi:ryncolin-1-like [Actinia tenebrosa]|uniref:Ryncolin-1-like n=1 Tax=Actinia tenebrosa TaxID=6105 RepID=A0A6P8HB81_ACTTE|nr:ryncolin-1-like [Actinia tenebrosa]